MIEKFKKIFDGLEERFGYHQLDSNNGEGKKLLETCPLYKEYEERLMI